MFGDDLKKSLEPIKTSDELLEKTRLAIEKARLEQAKASLEPAHTESKKRSSFGFSWKMVVPIACALFVVGGAVMVSSYVNKSKSAKKDGIKTHNKAIEVADFEIDAALGGDNYDYADTTAANTVEAVYEDEGELESVEWSAPAAEETTAAAETTVAGNGQQQKSEGSRSILPSKDSDFSESVQLESGLLCISEDHRSLIMTDPKTGKALAGEEGKSVPDFSFLSDDQRIQGLNYQEEYGVLFVSVGSDSNNLGQAKTQHLYACAYKDGILQSEKPESVD